MFPSSPVDKNCIGPDNCPSDRNNASCRFPVGVTSLGDENQHIRIQLAVNKYNSSANNASSNRCSIISPVRHSFLRNSLKAKDFEGETERTSKKEKKIGNQYEGVGDFPTIHLKKSAVRYRPIRRFNDVKIPYPELPVNRFLSHLPEVCPDLKSSNRSVLDVLEDFSGKKILTKEDSGNNKPKSKGLGGDYITNPNAVYSPLFVQKPKVNSVLTRDNTTQTFTPLDVEATSLQNNNLFIRNDASDSRAELRKKLAKQNNEIFASLSSSISSSFILKRKRDTVLKAKEEENVTNGSVAKKSKVSDDQLKNDTESNISNFSGWPKTKADKLNRKSKLQETNSPTSPNKDRLMTIFLDMQNTSPKDNIYKDSLSLDHPKSAKNSLKAPTINGFKSKVGNVNLNGFSETKIIEIGEGEKSAFKNSSSSDFCEKATSLELKKQENGQPNNSVVNFTSSKTEATVNDILKTASTPFQFGVNASNTSNFSFSKTSELSQVETESSLSGISENNTINENVREKNDNSSQVSEKSFMLGNSNVKANDNSFIFGTESNNFHRPEFSPKDSKAQTSKALNVSVSSNSTPQIAFNSSAGVTTIASQNPSVKVDVSNTQGPLLNNTLLGQNSTETVKIEEKNEISNGVSPSVAGTTEIIQTGAFCFAQKSGVNSDKTFAERNVPDKISSTNEVNNKSFLPSGIFLNNNTANTKENKNVFTFTQGKEIPVTSTSPSAAVQEQKLSFSFGKKFDTDQKKEQEGFEDKSSTLFSFGQKSAPGETAQSIAEPANVTSESQSTTIKSNALIEQVPTVANNSPAAFGQALASSVTDSSGAKSEAGSFGGITSPAFRQNSIAFPIKTNFESAGGFGNITPQASFSFGKSTSSTSGFVFGSPTTTQPAQTFGVSSVTTQPTHSFGVSSVTTQPTQTFGVSSVTTQPTQTFGVSSVTTQPTQTFGVSSVTTQPTHSFGVSSVTTQPTQTFGVSSAATQPAQSFGVSSVTTQPSQTFGVSSVTTQPTHSFGVSSVTTQPTQTFGVSSVTTQPTQTFGVSSVTTQPTQTFGVSSVTAQPALSFGVSSASQSNLTFQTPTTSQSVTEFGTTRIANSTPEFGVPSTTQVASTFGVSSTTQSAPCFKVTSTTQSISSFGTSTKPSFGVSSSTQSNCGFGNSTLQSPSSFGVSSSSQPNSLFGAPTSSSSAVKFGTTTIQSSSTFGTSPCFSTASSTLPHTSFGGSIATSTPGFGTTQSSFSSLYNKSNPSPSQTTNIFGQNLAPNFSSTTARFSSSQSNVFGQKTSTEENAFDQNKTQQAAFGNATQTFGSQGKIPFGISTTNVTGFNTSPPNTTAAPIFSFGASSTSGSNNMQPSFSFKSPINESFKFGAATTKEGSGFGGTNTSTFTFGAGQVNNNTMAGPTSAFNFGSTQVSSFAPFSFGTTPSPSAFSFGSSTSSASSGSGFCFGTPNPISANSFGQSSTPSPAAAFPVPGTFCIGSGSSQSRPRATSRPRRRP